MLVNEHLKHENTLVFKANEYKVPVGDELTAGTLHPSGPGILSQWLTDEK
jgi:hypothetical protein